jgi:hypothetical protein
VVNELPNNAPNEVIVGFVSQGYKPIIVSCTGQSYENI